MAGNGEISPDETITGMIGRRIRPAARPALVRDMDVFADGTWTAIVMSNYDDGVFGHER